jgi:indolepyruvate ferredoxin oxidoreductase alpha subunit
VRNRQLIKDYALFEDAAAASRFNWLKDGKDHSMGIIACGLAYNYLMENFPDGCPYPVLKVSQYPFPRKLALELASMTKTILVLEEGQPLVEERLRGVFPTGITIRGRIDNAVNRDGELTPDAVRAALGLPELKAHPASEVVAPRPPALCQGCGHRDFFTALNNVLKDYEGARVFGDIGCYTLGWMPPFHSLHTCVEMGASVTMANGSAYSGTWPAVAVIGDSTFTHSGMTGLLDAVNENADIVVCISDNLTTGMTGGQDSAGTGRLEAICAGLGVDPAHIRTIVPLPKNYPEMEQVIKEEVEYHGVSVIISRRECIQTLKRHAKK